MEEVWLERNPGEESSVHLQDFPKTPSEWRAPDLAERFSKIRQVRRVVTGAMEVERREKRIGSSLEAAPKVYVADTDTAKILNEINFADLCITSAIEVINSDAPKGAFTIDDVNGVGVEFVEACGEKCLRCWKILPDVGTHKHAGTCARCDEALS